MQLDLHFQAQINEFESDLPLFTAIEKQRSVVRIERQIGNSYSNKIENKQRFCLRGIKKIFLKSPPNLSFFSSFLSWSYKSCSNLSVYLLSFKDFLIIIDISTTLLIPKQHKYEHCLVSLLTRCLWKRY